MLNAVEARVLGSLVEKQLTTPDQYPLTLNALVLACNQSTNREPVMHVEPFEVDAAIVTLKDTKLARVVHPTSGRGVTKYRQVAEETLRWEPDERAVLCLLLLRGPQTSGELRTRSERLHDFASVSDVEVTLARLAAGEGASVVRLERQPGQKEPRWATTLAKIVEPAGGDGDGGASGSSSGRADRLADLEARVADLEHMVRRLSDAFGELVD